jgi:hypothetical protein
MKLKEIPVSLFFELKLRLLNLDKLKSSNGKELPVVVSLTSIPSRLSRLHITIKSVLNQSSKPSKIVLWLHDTLQNSVPSSLYKLQGDIFEIKFTNLNSSHVKLLPSLTQFPNHIIVTCDDDLIYDFDWLKGLYEHHLKSPNAIVAHTVRQIQMDDNGNFLPYNQWRLRDNNKNNTFLAIGSSGILYPKKCFSNEIHNQAIYMKLAPKADDLWFKAVAMISNVQIEKTKKAPKYLIPVMATQQISLKKENIGQNKNNIQWQALVEYFNLKF